MTSYKIYLTVAPEVARRLAMTFDGNNRAEDVKLVYTGQACGDDRIPSIYYDKEYYCCIVELKENGENDAPTYELTIC